MVAVNIFVAVCCIVLEELPGSEDVQRAPRYEGRVASRKVDAAEVCSAGAETGVGRLSIFSTSPSLLGTS